MTIIIPAGVVALLVILALFGRKGVANLIGFCGFVYFVDKFFG